MGSVTSNPKVNIQLLPAAVVTAYADRRDLIFGEIPASGATAVSKALNSDVHTKTTSEIKTLFGTATHLTNSILEWKASNEGHSPLDVIGIDSAGSSVADASIVFGTGPATTAGSYTVTAVDGSYSVTHPVAVADTVAEISAALAVLINALTDAVITADGTTTPGTLAIDTVDSGTLGNNYSIDIQGTIGAVTVALTGFANGAGAPTIDDTILDNIEGIRYTGVLWPVAWLGTISIITDELKTRFNASNRIMDGVAFMGSTATYAAQISAAATANTQVFTVLCGRTSDIANEHDGDAVVRPNDWLVAEFMGIRSRRMTTGAPIADYITTTSGSLDAFGGPSLASLPYFNTPLRNTPVTSSAHLWNATEQVGLEDGGGATYGVNSAQNAMITGPIVTTYLNDGAGNVNDSFKYLNYVDTGSVCREVFYNVLKSVYAQSRLTEGDLIPNRSMANAESIKAQCLTIYKTLSGLGLTQAGREAESYFNQNTTVAVSLVNRSVTIVSLLPIVTQLGTINYSLQLSFTITGTGTQITV